MQSFIFFGKECRACSANESEMTVLLADSIC